MEYTAIGDTVNTASRLQSKANAGEILISEETKKHLTKNFKLARAGPYELKGKSEKLKAFEVVY